MQAILRYVGTATALIFVGIILLRHAVEIPKLNLASTHTWLTLASAFALYILSQLLGAVAWRATLSIHDVALPRARAESQLLVSQIGKYIPGNVAHFLGRFGLARSDGVQSATIASSLLLEVGFLLTSGVLIVGVLLLIIPEFIATITTDLPKPWLDSSVIIFYLGLLACIAICQYLIWRKAGKPKPAISKCAVLLLLYSLNFLILGMSLWFVTHAIDPRNDAGVLQCMAIFTTAWVAGFLMPGAPGGVGIRDGIIALGLGLFVGQGAGLGAAIIHRAISVIGDVGVFALGVKLRRIYNRDKQESA